MHIKGPPQMSVILVGCVCSSYFARIAILNTADRTEVSAANAIGWETVCQR